MTEKMRTIILLVLLLIAIGFIFWMNGNVDSNFVDQLETDSSQTD